MSQKHHHEHRGTDLREPRPTKSRTGLKYEAQRVDGPWVERRVKEMSGLEGREEIEHADR